MVRRTLITLAALLSASMASAQTADWRAAGGDLFAAVDTGEPVAELSAAEPLDTPRLAPLSQPFMAAIATAAERHGLDPKLLHALVVVESAYRNEACSPVGACGLAQLMPGTAAELGVRDRFDPAENLSGGAAYLARQMLRFGDLRLALAAYNAGPGRVARLGRIPDIRETQEYVVSVVDCYLALTAGRGVRSSRECRAGGAR
ncbi:MULTISPECIES: lytic transglycosylase domain-containing protein [unclassified Brevundimonas]|jgi:soluble lytic murein transglycosylase-like protein|uniref:lytic transglycosylase domain-containing protein n=1 Tax=unclassified Brevundimonas TaxID=2622653 RepID=UPI00128FB71A|nr:MULTISPECIES: lytic transglycosylase domain-containing protein [unclassified Brevundimonas]MBU4196594.1 lytic transglycosylase domain-containing protein [Alphaproteobacteria bacterium]MCG2663389.1 lytic transglycosylase domain-containing protein [Brevundimonas sp.]QFU32361.1 Membrane-bound lytic murein transglycosylase F precursor [Brevundimonas sp. Bb-A]